MKRVMIAMLLVFITAVAPLVSASTQATGTEETTTANTQKNIKVTFVELGSVRCIPCKKMMPIMKEIEEEYGDQVKVVFHDVWTPEGKQFVPVYKIRIIPTQVFLDKDGNEYFRHEGFFPKEELVAVLKQGGVK